MRAGELFCKSQNKRMKPKIILIHGFAASKREWEPQIPFFEKMGYEVFAKDLLGHGDGIKPKENSQYTMDAMDRDFAEWLSSMAASDPIILIGHSMGASVALRFSIKNPANIKKVILISPLIARSQITSIPPIFLSSPKFGSILMRFLPDWLIYHGISMDRFHSRGMNAEMIRRVTLDFKRADPKICYFVKTIVDISQDTGNIPTPALMIWGDQDRTLNPRFFSEFSLSHPDLIVHRVKNGGHTIHLTHREEVNATIEQFLLE